MLDALKVVRSIEPAVPVAGNVVTADGVRDLAGAGRRQGRCRTGGDVHDPMRTGVGRPQFSAVLECAEQAAAGQAHLGRRRHPPSARRGFGTGGAANVMVGSWFAGTYESPGDLHVDAHGRAYKESWMASVWCAPARPRSPRSTARKALFDEGISPARMYLDPDRPGVEDLLDAIVAGVRSARARARGPLSPSCTNGRSSGQSQAGYAEGRPRRSAGSRPGQPDPSATQAAIAALFSSLRHGGPSARPRSCTVRAISSGLRPSGGGVRQQITDRHACHPQTAVVRCDRDRPGRARPQRCGAGVMTGCAPGHPEHGLDSGTPTATTWTCGCSGDYRVEPGQRAYAGGLFAPVDQGGRLVPVERGGRMVGLDGQVGSRQVDAPPVHHLRSTSGQGDGDRCRPARVGAEADGRERDRLARTLSVRAGRRRSRPSGRRQEASPLTLLLVRER